MPNRSNILYIFTDQQFAGAMSCAGNEDLHTPAMDRIAAQGVRFENATCTYPLCTPSRASMIAGRYPHELGITGNGQPIDPAFRAQELGHLLTGAGYDCAYGGKWHVPEIAMPEGHGFRVISGFDDPGLPGACRAFLAEEHDRPFFLVAGFDNPHNICEWRRQQNVPWGEIGAPPRVEACPMLPANFAIPPYEPEAIRIIAGQNPRIYPDDRYSDEQWRRYRWAYYRLVEQVDALIGQILDALDETGQAEKTVILFSSDHGDGHGAHHLVQKSFLYDEAVRVPMVVSAPWAEQAGAVVADLPISNGLDVYATVCDLAGVALPEGCEGRSLMPFLTGDAPEAGAWREAAVSETYFAAHNCAGRLVRTRRYTYVAYEWGAYREQLFDMEQDPGEMVNLAVYDKYADVLQRHRDLLRAWCARTGDTFYGHHYAHPDIPFMVPGDPYPQST
jgi:arylsulfatase A-like enzyme